MARRNKIPELEQKHGNLERIIPALVNRGGQKLAAEKLETSQNTISRWLKDNHYISRVVWMKAATPQELLDIEAAAGRVAEAEEES
jgi:hypothetical protein